MPGECGGGGGLLNKMCERGKWISRRSLAGHIHTQTVPGVCHHNEASREGSLYH